jgi:transcriptional regulator with XRE-family HTH domain
VFDVAKAARDPELAHQFGTRLRTLRHQAGLTQEQLATAAGLDRTFPGRLERGVTTPNLNTIIRLATALNVRPGELIDRLDD